MFKNTFFVVSVVLILACASPVYAQRGGPGGGGPGGGGHGPGPGPGGGPGWGGHGWNGGGHGGGLGMAADIVSIVANGMQIMYYGGAFYRSTPTGYVVMAPPAGVVVPALPMGYAITYLNGVPYYYYGSNLLCGDLRRLRGCRSSSGGSDHPCRPDGFRSCGHNGGSRRAGRACRPSGASRGFGPASPDFCVGLTAAGGVSNGWWHLRRAHPQRQRDLYCRAAGQDRKRIHGASRRVLSGPSNGGPAEKSVWGEVEG